MRKEGEKYEKTCNTTGTKIRNEGGGVLINMRRRSL